MALQRVWRAALSKKKQRFDKLNLIWSQAFGLVLEEACKRKLAKRKKKSRKNPTSVYFAISPLRKSQVLIQWYSDARQRYLSKLKEYIVARRAGAQTAPPEFAYAPDLEEMKQLIEKAATLDL